MDNIIGYTTIGQQNSSKILRDLELAKQDLINHFNIRKGEKWTNPNFGSDLPYLVFQPLDEITVEQIKDDVRTVVSYDPRFALISELIDVREDESYVTVVMQLNYLPSTTATELAVKFDKEFA